MYYPKNATQPMKEDALMSGKLESTNEPYAIAKITGIKMCESYNRQYGRDYRSVMPTNLYGPNDNFHPKNSHVIPAMMKRFHDAVEMKDDEVTVWGTGKPMREFLHVDDMASACIHIMNIDQEELYKIISKHSGQKYDKVYADSDRDYWMKADKALEYGMIDEILTRS